MILKPSNLGKLLSFRLICVKTIINYVGGAVALGYNYITVPISMMLLSTALINMILAESLESVRLAGG